MKKMNWMQSDAGARVLHLLPQVLIVDGLTGGRAEFIGKGHPHDGSGGCVR